MKFVVVGGGTAGWLTALFLNKHYPEDEVTVVASSEIGILGAGEGTTPPFMDFLKDMDIAEEDLYTHCKATKKTGIKFTNWHGDGTHYFHNFSDGLYAVHFDASLVAKYFQTVALERDVVLIDDEVISLNGNDTELYTKSGNKVKYDFLFDCSGFRRLFVEEHYNAKWLDYQMPCKRAIPFFLPNDGKDLPEYTESIAMKYGWIWKIPVNGRYGCGYVFDSSMTTDEEAKQEIRDYLGHDFTSPKTFNFSPGCFENSWNDNCVAIGLSAGFIEPLEATSIWVQVMSLYMFKDVFMKHPQAREKYNHDLTQINHDILSFLYFHYLTEREDSEFWDRFPINNDIPEKLQYLLSSEDMYKGLKKFNFSAFAEPSWKAIATGIRLPK